MVLKVDFKKLIESTEYNFLRTDEHLGNRIILLTLGGSHAYGTNNENSDIDIRGVTLEKSSDLIGFTEFKQVVETNTDTTIYAFNRIVELLLNSNPNTVEILGCKPEHYIFLTDIGQQMLDNKKMFLSQKCVGSFVGYANAQLNRLINKLSRGSVEQIEREEQILHSIQNAMLTFDERYNNFDDNTMKLYIHESDNEDLANEIFVDMNVKDYSLRELLGIVGELQNVLRQYDKVNHRNKKASDKALDKHAMHLIRLYLMGIDLLEKEEIITYREKDHDLLMCIRNGQFRKEDGKYDDSFFEMLEGYKKRFEYAKKNTSLPKLPDMRKVEEFVIEVNTKIVRGEV